MPSLTAARSHQPPQRPRRPRGSLVADVPVRAAEGRRRPSLWRRYRQSIGRGAMLGITVGFVGGVSWSVMTGRAEEALDWSWLQVLDGTAAIGFSVQEVVVLGRGVTDRGDLWEALGVERGYPIFAFDAEAARLRIMTLPWVRDVAIERRLPDVLYLTLEERHPIALWQRDQRVHLIDTEGVPLTETGVDQYTHLPLVVGEGAAETAADLIRLLADVPAVANRLEAAVRVGDRRWDLRLTGGITVQLPEHDMGQALARLARLDAEDAIFDRDIVAIDLRLADRVVIQATPETADRAQLPEENT